MPSGAWLHPLSAFLGPGLVAASPDVFALNRLAGERGLVTGSGMPLRFVPPPDDDVGYEMRAFRTGAVATRLDNRHDLFNALIWLAFPRAKAALNRRHVDALAAAQAQDTSARGALRDALTQFDECGVIVAGQCPALWQALRAHCWREVFVERREELRRTTRFVVFGHASHDALAAPFVGLCGKALWIEVDDDWLRLPEPASLCALDQRLADRFDSEDFVPRDWQPLPLLGIPGATGANEDPAYYDDSRQFRPARTMPAGSSPGSR